MGTEEVLEEVVVVLEVEWVVRVVEEAGSSKAECMEVPVRKVVCTVVGCTEGVCTEGVQRTEVEVVCMEVGCTEVEVVCMEVGCTEVECS